MKTAEELFSEYLLGIADIKIVDLRKVLAEHDKEITGLIDGLIDEIQKGYYEISNPFDIAQYDKGYIKALTELKQKIGDL